MLGTNRKTNFKILENLENGMYFVKIVTEFNSTLYYKFIKE